MTHLKNLLASDWHPQVAEISRAKTWEKLGVALKLGLTLDVQIIVTE
jgi:hypothetical protein